MLDLSTCEYPDDLLQLLQHPVDEANARLPHSGVGVDHVQLPLSKALQLLPAPCSLLLAPCSLLVPVMAPALTSQTNSS